MKRTPYGLDSESRRSGASIATAQLLSLLLIFSAAPTSAVVVNRILATVDGEPVTLYELKQFTEGNPLATQLSVENPQALVDGLITSRLIRLEIRRRGIVIGEAEVENYLTQIQQQNQINRDQLYQALSEQGLTPKRYRAQVREELERAQLINREIRGKVNVTPEDIQRYYDANLADYEHDPEVTVSHIVFRLTEDAPASEVARVEQKATEIHDELDRGKDFGDLARQYSEDPAAESDGSLGTFRVGTMLDALNEAVVDLEVGDYSEPVRSRIGFHIVRLDARSEKSHTPLEELSEDIRERLYNEALEERYARWLTEDLRERHHVEMIE